MINPMLLSTPSGRIVNLEDDLPIPAIDDCEHCHAAIKPATAIITSLGRFCCGACAAGAEWDMSEKEFLTEMED